MVHAVCSPALAAVQTTRVIPVMVAVLTGATTAARGDHTVQRVSYISYICIPFTVKAVALVANYKLIIAKLSIKKYIYMFKFIFCIYLARGD